MKRKFFPAFLALCLILTMLPMSALAEEHPKVAPEASEASNEAQVAATVAEPEPATVTEKVAAIDETKYDTLAAAVMAAGTETSATIKLLANTTEDITIPKGADITLEIPESMTLTNKSGDTISNKGTLTITGAGTVDNTIHAKGALVNYPGGNVTLKDGITLTRSNEKNGNSWYVIKNMGTVAIENAKVLVDKEKGGSSSLIDNGWYDAADKNGNGNDRNTARLDNAFATLTITGGTFSGGMNTVKNDDCGILKITGGSFSNASGPNVLNWNETTINGGTFSDSSSSTGLIANGYNNNGFNAGMITITDGKFTASGNGTGFLLGVGAKSQKGGKFLIGGGTFTGGLTQVGVQLDYTFEITGGTFSADPKDYVKDGLVGVKNTDNKFEIKSYEDAFAPTFDLSKAGGVKADKLTLSGTVDPRTYTVTDPDVQSLFGTLLTDQKPADSAALRSESTAPVMYVKDNKHLSFGIIKFANLADDGNYIIQQINPALSYAYDKDAFPGNSKIKTYTGEQVKDGLCFMISDQPGDIIFKIAPVSASSVAAANTGTEPTLPENAATYTITNSVKFAASAAPAVTTVEIPATVTTSSSGEVIAKAEASGAVVQAAVKSAGTDGTVTIEAKVSNTDVNAVEVALTNDVVAALATKDKANVKEVVLETPVGTVTLSDNALKTIAGSSNNKGATVNVKQANVSTTIANAVAAFDVDVKSNSTAVEIKNLTTPIKLSFNIGAGLKNPVLMYLEGTTLKPIKSSSYNGATGIITGETTHLSTFAVVNSMGVETGGVGCEVTLTAANQNDYLTIQVTNGNANSIYTVKATDAEKKVVLYVKSGTVLNVWETSVVPTFTSGEFKPKEESTILVNNQTVTAS